MNSNLIIHHRITYEGSRKVSLAAISHALKYVPHYVYIYVPFPHYQSFSVCFCDGNWGKIK